MRWIKRIWTAALVMAATAGCKQQCFITEGGFDHAQRLLAAGLENMPLASQAAATSILQTPTPNTVLDPDRPPRYLSLAEAISKALEKGTRGSFALNGQGDDTLVRATGGNLSTDQIRVLALDPAIAETAVEASLSKFDAVFQSSMSWNVTDRPIGTALDAFQAGRAGALNAIQTDAATFNAAILKPLPTGGVAGITFNTQYQFTNLPAAVNPSYTPSLQFQFEQPLLQGFGVEINQLRAAFPQPILAAIPGNLLQPTSEGILLTRIRYDQSRADFEANVSQMVLNVEVAYWNLYSAYWNLYSRELGLRLAYESWRTTRTKHLAGGAQGIKLADVARTRGQYELFRGQRIDALSQVLEGERQLRKLMGEISEDGTRLIPSDTPTLSPYQPDWQTSLEEALNLRPELVIAREDLKIQQLTVIEQKNSLLPDLRFTATYDINALGGRLDGADNNNAFRNLARNDFNNYSLGFRLNVPLGYRGANANLRRARLALARSYALLKDQEEKTEQFLALQYKFLFRYYEQIKIQRAQREAYGLNLRLLFLLVGEKSDLSQPALLETQRFFAEALAQEYAAIVNYNNTLATFEYAKGTLLKHNNVVIGEGELPTCAQERAADHHARRNAAIVLAERKAPLHCSGDGCDHKAMLPQMPQSQPGSLPSLLENQPKVPDDRDMSDLPTMGRPERGLPMGMAPAAFPGSAGSASAAVLTPPARPEAFGASRMLPSSVLSRDSAPSLAPVSLGTPQMP